MSSTSASMRSVRLAPSTTFAPLPARRRAVLSPMPLLAPVITTTLSAIFGVLILSFSCEFGLAVRLPVGYCGLRDLILRKNGRLRTVHHGVGVFHADPVGAQVDLHHVHDGVVS